MKNAHRWGWLALTLLLVGVTLAAVQRGRTSGLPEIAIVPGFRITNQRGKPFGLEDLAGRVWIANFMFTSCPDVCPLLTQRMVALHRRLASHGDAVHFVSFSVDPQTDTPEVLTRYARERGADYPNWTFLTGSTDDLRKVIVGGFKGTMQPVEEPGKPANILHGSHFVLVDGAATIRGYYATEGTGLDTLARHVTFLLSRGGRE
jgi:protein SCO1/2